MLEAKGNAKTENQPLEKAEVMEYSTISVRIPKKADSLSLYNLVSFI